MTISLSEFNSLPEIEKKEVLYKLKSDLGVSGIVRAWEISRSKVYSMLNEFDISLDSKKGPKAKAQKPKVSFESESKGDRNVQDTSEFSRDIESQEHEKSKIRNASSLELDETEKNKFSLYLDTQGTGRVISETLNLLLGSEQLSNSDLHLNISIEEM